MSLCELGIIEGGGLCPVLDYFHPKFARFR